MFKQTFKDSCGAFCKGSHGANLCWWLNQKLKILVNIYSIDFSLQVSYYITKKSMDKDSINSEIWGNEISLWPVVHYPKQRLENHCTSKLDLNTFFCFLIFPFLISCGLGGNFCGVFGWGATRQEEN